MKEQPVTFTVHFFLVLWIIDIYSYLVHIRGGGVMAYMGYIGMCRCEGYGFQAVHSGIGYINHRVQVQNRVSFSMKLINWLKILVQTRETVPGIATQKYEKIKSYLFWLDCVCDVSSLWKIATPRQGWGFWEFSLVAPAGISPTRRNPEQALQYLARMLRKKISFCLNRGREESVGNGDVSIFCARKYLSFLSQPCANFMLPKSLSGILSMLLLYMQLKTLSRSLLSFIFFIIIFLVD